MPSAPPSRVAEPWRASLLAADAAAHDREAARVREVGFAELEARLVRANADRVALREAVRVRDALLRRFLAQEGQFVRRGRRRLGRLLRRMRR